MIDARTAELLQTILRREGRSLLQYLGEAFPWAKNSEQEQLRRFHGMVHEDLEAHAALARFLERSHIGVPYLGAYPSAYMTLNFVALDSLLPRLAQAQLRSIAALENDLTQIQEPSARGTVEGLLEVKRRHLKELEAMLPGAQPPAPPNENLLPQRMGS